MHNNNTTPPCFRPGLESLVSPLTPEQFLEDYWNKRCFVSHGDSSRLSELMRNLNPSDVPGMLAQSNSHFLLQAPHEMNAVSLQSSNMAALDMYERGAGSLYIHLYDGSEDPSRPNSAAWKKWLIQLSTDLGRLNHTGRVSVYASKETLGLKPHFDPNDNYTIQLSGRKRWYYSDDASYPAPDHASGTAFHSGMDLDQHMLSTAARYYVRNVHTISPPSEWKSVVLEPGSMLYVPRGFWHWTESLETSISLNISLFPGHWRNYLLPLIGRLVLKYPEWRETAHFGDASCKADIERLLDILKSEIESMEATDVLPGPVDHKMPHITDKTVLRRRILTQYHIQHSTQPTEDVDVLFIDIRGRTSNIKVPREALKTLEWIEHQHVPFTIANIKGHLTSTMLSLENFIGALIDADYLEQANSCTPDGVSANTEDEGNE